MTSVIDKLWDSNFAVEYVRPKMSDEMSSMLLSLDTLREKLVSLLSEEQCAALKEFEECYDSVTALSEREVFSYAFKIGARMGLEIADKETE